MVYDNNTSHLEATLKDDDDDDDGDDDDNDDGKSDDSREGGFYTSCKNKNKNVTEHFCHTPGTVPGALPGWTRAVCTTSL